MRNKSKFYKIYFSVIVLFLILLIAGLAVLYTWLRSYEKSQPATIVNTIITNYLQKGDYKGLVKDMDLEISEFETEENLEGVLSAALEGKEYSIAHSSFKPEGIDLTYVIKAGDEKVLNVYLKKHKLDKGYDVDHVELSKNLLKTIEIVVPKGTEITVNGIAVPDDLRTDNEFKSLPETVDVKTLTPTQTAKITGLLSDTPTVAATENGVAVEVSQNGNTYTVAQTIDQATGDKIKEIAEKAAVAYAAYMQKDGGLGALASLCDTSTPFYKNVASSITMFVKAHNGYRNDDMQVSGLTKYSDSLYSCRVSFKHVLLLSDTTYTDDFDKIVFVTKDAKGEFKVIDMQAPVSNSDED
ncbi:MAG: hypothetical protein IKT24_00485 [Clostridia bacterium]|nr:hypothetical protein [Clostridia bacterium]